jgi:putative inorganic carbon (hco3(-)) transporter
MSRLAWSAGSAVAAALIALALVAVTRQPATAERASTLYVPAVALLLVLAVGYLVWSVEPAYTFSAAIVLTPFAGNWPEIGIPGPASPDRLLLAGAILAVILRAPAVADRPRLRITSAHWFLALGVAYALISAFLAGTLFERDSFLKIVDTFGIMPFLAFLTAPLAFRTPEQRRVLLVALVALGAYLGLTTIFEMIKLDALVWPKYIVDPNFGIHRGRGRGPFADAVANGLALFTCAAACGIAVATWRDRRARAVAIAVGLLCIAGTFLCLERSVWIGAVLGTTVAMLAIRGLWRYFLPVVAAIAVVIAASLAFLPGLSATVHDRLHNNMTIWDRQNLTRAAVNMLEVKPLFGFGWSRFQSDSADYFEQAFDYPLTATGAGVHNTPLTYAVELGLAGMTLWLLGILLGVGGALSTRGPPDLFPWRVALLAVAMAFLVVANAVPPTAWANRSLWLLAGVVSSGAYATVAAARRPEPPG